MRRQVAIKVIQIRADQDQRILRRFLTEIRAVARLKHSNIIAAFDAGESRPEDEDGIVLHYFVMEYVPGQDLEQHVKAHGPLTPTLAADLMYQIASALSEAHRHHLVHRDIKPSNILITPEGQAKLLDFGLARNFHSSKTESGSLIGTVDYMAPEQMRDAHTVDVRADLYGLGGTLFWCLTATPPFPGQENVIQELNARLSQPPPSLRKVRPELPGDLDALVQKLLALHPDDRYPTAESVMQALVSFLKPARLALPSYLELTPGELPAALASQAGAADNVSHRLLVVDDEAGIRAYCRHALHADGFLTEEAASGQAAMKALASQQFDLIVMDLCLPDVVGTELCKRLRENPSSPHLKIILMSGNDQADTMAQLLLCGADDFLTKPFSRTQLRARVRCALRLKDAQDRSGQLTAHLLAANLKIEGSLHGEHADLVQSRNAVVLALAKLVEHKASEKGGHLVRVQRYCRCLAEEAVKASPYAEQIDANFIEMMVACAPLHDIGKVCLPDHILHKPGKLTPDERLLMQQHTIIGAETLQEVTRQHPGAMAFLQMALDLVRHHHERWDGRGYPDRLAGTDIPLAARLLTVGDVYDALRSRRVYKPALAHRPALQVMHDWSPGQFDPALLQVLLRCECHFERIFREVQD